MLERATIRIPFLFLCCKAEIQVGYRSSITMQFRPDSLASYMALSTRWNSSSSDSGVGPVRIWITPMLIVTDTSSIKVIALGVCEWRNAMPVMVALVMARVNGLPLVGDWVPVMIPSRKNCRSYPPLCLVTINSIR